MNLSEQPIDRRISTGIASLDVIMNGGLTENRLYLIEGSPGTGKTTLSMQFLLDGVRKGETGLYVTLSETKRELEGIARSHGWSLDGIEIYELVDPSESIESQAQYTMFEPSEIELGSTIQGVLKKVKDLNPSRVVLDSLSEMRLLSQGPLRYRRQILALKQFFVGRNCTTLMLDDHGGSESDQQLQSIAHGVIRLEQLLSDYGGERRRLRIIKHRGCDFIGGTHDVQLTRGGMKVFPRKTFEPVDGIVSEQQRSSGNEALDELLGGGLMAGTSALLLGPAGVGKSSTVTQYAVAAAERGERAVFFQFEESRHALMSRSKGLGLDLQKYIDAGLIAIHHLTPGEVTPSEFADCIRKAVEPDDQGRAVSVVSIDSLNGYLNSMPHEKFLTIQLHDLLQYLGRRGIVTLVVVAQHGMLGQSMQTPVDTSYLADSVILFRYFEAAGEIRQAISVVKKRTGSHERTIREFKLSDHGLVVGPPLREFRGVLAGTPEYVGDQQRLLQRKGRTNA
ncbi:Circadian clock protein kinase KaiC [Novipirellula galeiformis]|uniref:non-specific serine/threonine protein kinase n=1 Tax=Novipirellula galeiformis TaxID=2528004 RepID=A0A5C6C2U5_9BACT|nr:ATPase domain-containing protein [Novipirellula galeiformis]TWU17574.1 Circadian clock protein kinase KaiC [Novipirellula galeiformis]